MPLPLLSESECVTDLLMHTNPSTVICNDILTCELPQEEYDLVTMIGSALHEIGAYTQTFEKISEIMRPGGYFMYMDFDKYHKKEELLALLPKINMEIEQVEEYKRYSSMSFYCMKIRRIV